jgi:hypothetical protein
LVLTTICYLSAAPLFVNELRETDVDAIPFVVFEIQKKSLAQKKSDGEDVKGLLSLMQMLRTEMLIMRVQAVLRGIIGRKHRLAQMLMQKRQQNAGSGKNVRLRAIVKVVELGAKESGWK